MSIEAYKIAVRVSLIDGVTRGLALMSRHFKGTDADAKALEARLKSIGKMASLGAASFAVGAGGLALFKGPIEEAMKYERALGTLRQMGLGDAQIRDARKFAEATDIIGTSINDRIRIFSDAQGSFRQSGMTGARATAAAKTMLPVLAQYEVATSMLSGEKRAAAVQSMRNLNKTVEIMGGINDPKRAMAIADAVFKATMSSGRMVDERQLKQFVAYGSSATNQLNLSTIFGGLEPIIGELGGSQTAVGLRTAYGRTNGMMALMPRRLQAEMTRLGMMDASGKQQTDNLARLQATNVIAYAQNLLGRYAKVGITSRTDIERENSIILGTGGAKVFNKIMSQLPILLESLAAYNKAQPPKAVINDPQNKALLAATNLQKKEADLKLKIGQTILPYYIRGLELAAAALTRLDKFVDSNPVIAKWVVGAFAVMSAAAVVGGALAVFGAGIRGLLLIRNLVPAFRAVGVGLSILRGGLGYLPMLFRYVVAALGPVGLAIAAIATVGWLVYNNWKEIKSALFANFKDIGDAVRKLFNGDIMGAIGLFGRALLRSFQTVLNTVIAGLNSMTGLGIAKFTFADPEQPAGSKFVAPAADKVFQATNNVYLDGYRIAMAVTKHQAKEAARPNAGSTGFDGQRARPSHALGAIR